MEFTERKYARAQLTKLITAAQNLLTNEEINFEDLAVIKNRIVSVNSKLTVLNESVKKYLKEEDFEEEFQKVYEYEDRATEILSRLQYKSEAAEHKEGKRLVNTGSEEVVNTTINAEQMDVNMVQGRSSSIIKLPKLELRKFNGGLSKWTPFWEQFRATVHENDCLSSTMKFNYLQTLLTDRAAAAISGLTPSEACYNDAVEMLQNQFGNQNRIIDTYVNKLLAINPIRNRNDVYSLRNLYNTASSVTRTFKSLGVNSSEYGMIVKSVLLKNIPYATKIDYHRKFPIETTKDVNIEIEQLMNFLKVEVESLEAAQSFSSTTVTKVYQKREDNKGEFKKMFHQNHYDRKEFTASSLLSSVDTNCMFCDAKDHNLFKCTSYLSLDQKKAILKKNNRCFRCLKPNHSSKYCKSKVSCDKCKGRHVTVICDPNYSINKTALGSEGHSQAVSNLLTKSDGKQTVLLQTAKAFIFKEPNIGRKDLFVRLIIDGGSQLSYIKESVARELNLKILGSQKLTVIPFGCNIKSSPIVYNKVEVHMLSQYNNVPITITAIEVPEICLDALEVPRTDNPTINSLALADVCIGNSSIVPGLSLLIGADYYWKVVTGENIRLSNNLTAVNTKFGWTIHGPSNVIAEDVNVNLVTTLHTHYNDSKEEISVKKFWDLETIGIQANENEYNKKIPENFIENKIKFTKDRYEVELPWKDDSHLDNNYKNAFVRLKLLTSKLIKNGKLIEYDKAVRSYENMNFAEKVPTEENFQGNIYYMPHKPVYRESSATTKLRVVFDASSHAPGYSSLNEHLLIGEKFVPDLLQLLLNFRVGEIAITADIEKAFLQIGVREKDRNVQRYLWYDEPISDTNKLPKIGKYRMTRVTFGIASSPFLLAATLQKHFNAQEEDFKQVCELLKESFYVDDCVIAMDGVDNAINFYGKAKILLKRAGMNLRKWETNNQTLLQHFDDVTESTKYVKILGVVWDKYSDKLSVNLSSVLDFHERSGATTKRIALQIISRVFDPLGILGPFTIKAKILIQKIWKLNLVWDCELPTDLLNEWTNWCFELKKLQHFSIPRLITKIHEEVELHVFSDASKQAYGAVAYLKLERSGEPSVGFLVAKNRVAPLKTDTSDELSLPRLELTACVCAARLKSYIMQSMKIKPKNTFLWSDSKISLYWIKGTYSKWKPYVSNRVREIQNTTRDSVWRHCPGKENPADLLTRGVSASVLQNSQLWLNGPKWLSKNKIEWHADDISSVDKYSNNLLTMSLTSINVDVPSTTLFPIQNYEKLEKIIRITSYVQRFFLKNKKKHITIQELKKAEQYWIKQTQQTYYMEEINCLKTTKCVQRSSKIHNLTPFLDNEGIIRLKGRLQESNLSFEQRHPIILPKNAEFVKKLIWQKHRECLHGGVNLTLSTLRNKFWIVQGRQAVKSIIRTCVMCRRLRGKLPSETFAPLPKMRVTEAHPFDHTGIDFAGPLYVKTSNSLRNKVYIMLFTCAVTRAVHLEAVLSISTESCIRGLRRFVSRRGTPTAIYSDNAAAFKRAELELKALIQFFENKNIQEFFQIKRIEWKYIVERAAWWGGFWERMVRTVKIA